MGKNTNLYRLYLILLGMLNNDDNMYQNKYDNYNDNSLMNPE